MSLVLDASMASAWLLKRHSASEAQLAIEALDAVRAAGALVPSLWFAEIGNTLLRAERQRVISLQDSTTYLAGLSVWHIIEDTASPRRCQAQVMQLGRIYGLTIYDAIYLELALRSGLTLATCDQQLAEATRKAGGRVFGDR